MPTSKEKPRSFAFTMSEVEYLTLGYLAKRDGRSMAGYLRRLIEEMKQGLELVDASRARYARPNGRRRCKK